MILLFKDIKAEDKTILMKIKSKIFKSFSNEYPTGKKLTEVLLTDAEYDQYIKDRKATANDCYFLDDRYYGVKIVKETL